MAVGSTEEQSLSSFTCSFMQFFFVCVSAAGSLCINHTREISSLEALLLSKLLMEVRGQRIQLERCFNRFSLLIMAPMGIHFITIFSKNVLLFLLQVLLFSG